MYLMFYEGEDGGCVYTLSVNDRPPTRYFAHLRDPKLIIAFRCVQKVAPDGTATQSAHPARFSPDDKFSRERIVEKKRFGLLPTQKPPPVL